MVEGVENSNFHPVELSRPCKPPRPSHLEYLSRRPCANVCSIPIAPRMWSTQYPVFRRTLSSHQYVDYPSSGRQGSTKWMGGDIGGRNLYGGASMHPGVGDSPSLSKWRRRLHAVLDVDTLHQEILWYWEVCDFVRDDVFHFWMASTNFLILIIPYKVLISVTHLFIIIHYSLCDRVSLRLNVFCELERRTDDKIVWTMYFIYIEQKEKWYVQYKVTHSQAILIEQWETVEVD